MKIDKQTFDLDEELSISIDFEDNDGLIFIPKNVIIEIKIVNYFGKIVINSSVVIEDKHIDKTYNKELDNICDECKNEDESVSQNLILTGFKICKSCRVSKTIFPI